MTKAEFLRIQHLTASLSGLGFTVDEVDQLRKISNTLRRWFERECGTDAGAIERDEETGKPFFRNRRGRRWPVPDLEAGARKRLAAILAARNARFDLANGVANWKCVDGTFDILDEDGEIIRYNVPASAALVSAYIQTDPRGAALYILRPGDVPDGKKAECHYLNGICVY